MTDELQSFADVIGLWPSVGALAEKISVKEITARQWKLRQSIPGEYWQGIVEAAGARAAAGEYKFAAVTLDLLARLAANAGSGSVRSTGTNEARVA